MNFIEAFKHMQNGRLVTINNGNGCYYSVKSVTSPDGFLIIDALFLFAEFELLPTQQEKDTIAFAEWCKIHGSLRDALDVEIFLAGAEHGRKQQ